MATKRKPRPARAETREDATGEAAAAAAEITEVTQGKPARRRALQRNEDGSYDELGGVLAGVAIGGGAIALEGELLPGVLIGAAAMLVARMFPRVAGIVGGVARPAVKIAVRAGYGIVDSARGAVAEAQEQFHDIVAEVEAERGGRRVRRRAA